MKNVNLFLSGLIICTLISNYQGRAAANTSGDKDLMHGFKLIEKRFIKEVNADCYFYLHEASGAKLVKIAAADPNKTFSISFHTLPGSDNGIAHIMEHSVLNGSKNFPVKSPFDIAVKGSLNTFINAFTSKDRTAYPVASMNEKDYFNLMHIYLDAVFFPNIHTDPRILAQEGWHHDLSSVDSEIEYRGVVYGEMKGVFSNPSRYLNMYLYRNLFPDNEYRYESGGFPEAIPSLTQEEFVAFHKKYYHPDNSFIVLYGDGDLNKELEFIHTNYLSKFTKRNQTIQIKVHKPFTQMKRVSEFYPVMEGAPTQNQTYLSLSYVNNYGIDKVKTQSIALLGYYLINRESAAIRLALLDAGIGKNVSCSSMDYKQNVVQIQVQNANVADLDKFYEIIQTTLKNIVEKGIDKKEFESVLNAFEFQAREDNNAQKGITYFSALMPDFMYSNNPFVGLEYETTIVTMRSNLNTDYYEKLIQSVFLNNPHALLLSLAPKAGLDKEIVMKEKQVLANYKNSLNPEQIQKLVEETKSLIEYQKSEDKPEALAAIPILSLSDINPKAQFFGANLKNVGNFDILHRTEHTNGIVYLNLYFDMRTMPKELLPYASLLSNLLGSLNTENYTYGELGTEINRTIGGVNTYLTRYLVKNDDSKLLPKFVVSSKSATAKIDDLLRLNDEIINKSKLDDVDRIKTLLVRHLAQLDAQIKREAARLAISRFNSYLSNSGMFNELTAGYDYYMFVSKLVDDYDAKSKEISAQLKLVSDLIFNQENLVLATTCSNDDFAELSKKISSLTSKIKSNKIQLKDWNFDYQPKNEAIQTSSKVNYVYQGYNFKKLGYEYSGKMLILNSVISRNWLNQQVRVIGGAYGGYSGMNASGFIGFISYRDPNLSQTLKTYMQSPEFVANFTANEKEMTQFIIGAISDLDQPLSESARGSKSFSNYFMQLDAAYFQKERDEVLATSVEDLKAYSKMIADVLKQNVICVYGNSEIIEQNKDAFKSLIKMN
jgi:presequence protease